MCAISFLIAPNLILSKKAQGPGILLICPYWLSLTHSVGIWWSILRDKQKSLLFEDQTSDSSSSPSCSYKKILPHRLEYKQLYSCFPGRLQASQLWLGKGERWNLNLLSTPLGNHIYLPSHSSCIPQSQAACWWEWKSHNLFSTRRGEREWQYWEEWQVKRKNKNSVFQNCWACCYGDEPPFHLFSLTCFLICCFCHMEEDYFLFLYFSVLFPHNGGLS